MTTNRKTIEVRIVDGGMPLYWIGVYVAMMVMMIPVVLVAMVTGTTWLTVAAAVCLIILGFLRMRAMQRLKQQGLKATVRLDLNDLIPPQAEEGGALEEEPVEEPEPEAEEPEDDSPAEPQWFETPYPDPDVELKGDEATKA